MNHKSGFLGDLIIRGYQLLGIYDTADDLIRYKNKDCQPMITINILEPYDGIYNVRLDSKKGFVIVSYINGIYKDYNGSNVKLTDAYVTLENGAELGISIKEAREFIIKNFDSFSKLGEPYGTRVLNKADYDCEAKRFSNFSNN